MLDAPFASRFAADWISAWNRHDLDAILAHYADDFEMRSSYIAQIAGEPSGVLRGKAAVGAYWAAALKRMPDLRFTLIDTFVGVDSLIIHYQGARGPAAEVFEFGADGKVVRAAAHYDALAEGEPMSNDTPPVALRAADCPPRARPSNYPPALVALLDAKLAGREKRPLGEPFGLRNFGINLTRLAPGAVSALRHAHARQDEFIYVLEGTPTLITDAGDTPLEPDMCAGFRAGSGDAHQLVNRSDADVLYLEIGDRTPGDSAVYPNDDLAAALVDGQWRFTRKDGSDY